MTTPIKLLIEFDLENDSELGYRITGVAGQSAKKVATVCIEAMDAVMQDLVKHVRENTLFIGSGTLH